MKLAAKKNNKTSSTARVVDGKLILSYPDAVTPVVWQMNLAEAKASALEVREAKNNAFALVLKTAKNETVDIATFVDKTSAVDALMAASRALENSHGNVRPVASNDAAPVAGAAKSGPKWAGLILGILLIVVLIGVWSALAPTTPRSIDGEASATGTTPNFGGSEEPGVPLSADQFLLKQQQ